MNRTCNLNCFVMMLHDNDEHYRRGKREKSNCANAHVRFGGTNNIKA